MNGWKHDNNEIHDVANVLDPFFIHSTFTEGNSDSNGNWSEDCTDFQEPKHFAPVETVVISCFRHDEEACECR